jgi:uncharacterized protein YcnI
MQIQTPNFVLLKMRLYMQLISIISNAIANYSVEKSESKPGSIVPKYILKVISEPSIGGKILARTGYIANEKADIQAIPSPGWEFTRWSGNFASKNIRDTLVMDADKTVIAHFHLINHPDISSEINPTK